MRLQRNPSSHSERRTPWSPYSPAVGLAVVPACAAPVGGGRGIGNRGAAHAETIRPALRFPPPTSRRSNFENGGRGTRAFPRVSLGLGSSCGGADGRDAPRRLGRRAQAAPAPAPEANKEERGARGRAPVSARKTPLLPAGSPSPHRFSSSPPHERALRSLPPAPATGVFCFLFQLCAGT